MSTPLLGLALPADGAINWGTTVNTSITALLDSAVAGTTTLTTDADVTLTTTAEAANEARQAVLLCTGSRAAARRITAPAQSKTYVVVNATTGGFGITIGATISGIGPTTGVSIPAGKAILVAWNGSDFQAVKTVAINLASGDVTGTLPVANGGTGLASYTPNGVLYASGAGTLAAGSNFVFDGTYAAIGGTLSAWDLGAPVLQMRNASVYGSTGTAGFYSNAYFSSTGWKYISSGSGAAGYRQNSDTHEWFLAPTGTAGASATFTQAMRLDSVGNVQMQMGAVMNYAPAPATISTTATLTAANIQAQIINTTGTSYTVTMPLGTTLETLAIWAATNVSYDFFVINTASGTITIAANTGVTTLGSLTIAAGASAHFRIRRTATNTFVLYRLV